MKCNTIKHYWHLMSVVASANTLAYLYISHETQYSKIRSKTEVYLYVAVKQKYTRVFSNDKGNDSLWKLTTFWEDLNNRNNISPTTNTRISSSKWVKYGCYKIFEPLTVIGLLERENRLSLNVRPMCKKSTLTWKSVFLMLNSVQYYMYFKTYQLYKAIRWKEKDKAPFAKSLQKLKLGCMH